MFFLAILKLRQMVRQPKVNDLNIFDVILIGCAIEGNGGTGQHLALGFEHDHDIFGL